MVYNIYRAAGAKNARKMASGRRPSGGGTNARSNIGSAKWQLWQCKMATLAVQNGNFGSARQDAILNKKAESRREISPLTFG